LAFIRTAPGIPSPDEMLGIGMKIAVTLIAPRLEAMHWRVEKFPDPILITSDCPVMAWRRADPSRPISGVGIDTADENPRPTVAQRATRHDPRRSCRRPQPTQASTGDQPGNQPALPSIRGCNTAIQT
jgi:hypothetical protein